MNRDIKLLAEAYQRIFEQTNNNILACSFNTEWIELAYFWTANWSDLRETFIEQCPAYDPQYTPRGEQEKFIDSINTKNIGNTTEKFHTDSKNLFYKQFEGFYEEEAGFGCVMFKNKQDAIKLLKHIAQHVPENVECIDNDVMTMIELLRPDDTIQVTLDKKDNKTTVMLGQLSQELFDTKYKTHKELRDHGISDDNDIDTITGMM